MKRKKHSSIAFLLALTSGTFICKAMEQELSVTSASATPLSARDTELKALLSNFIAHSKQIPLSVPFNTFSPNGEFFISRTGGHNGACLICSKTGGLVATLQGDTYYYYRVPTEEERLASLKRLFLLLTSKQENS